MPDHLLQINIPNFEQNDKPLIADLQLLSPHELSCRGVIFRCATGRGGIRVMRQEGDGSTPVGMFPLREIFYREDRLAKPIIDLIQSIPLPSQAIKPTDGWCDDSHSPDYNRLIQRPYGFGHECLWREELVYDIILPLGYNDNPPIPGKGSAIFMHLARPNYDPTEGCVALSLEDMVAVLHQLKNER